MQLRRLQRRKQFEKNLKAETNLSPKVFDFCLEASTVSGASFCATQCEREAFDFIMHVNKPERSLKSDGVQSMFVAPTFN